ncbi:MAG: DUF11 domain-containing protein [Oscillospiraceae bacterium]|nr:DUF11 domain-containing protein [Oscillospiraceae bacterium]
MSCKCKRAISLTLVLIISLTVIMPVSQTALAAETIGCCYRVLTAGEAGDSSDWVEIARNGAYSLILRKDVLPLGWVNYPTSGTNGSYRDSNARNVVNNWFNNVFGRTARLRDFTVANNALQNIGYFAVQASGISAPTGTQTRTGDDVAFLLSYGEAALFCSMRHVINDMELTQSPDVARTNYGKLTPLPTAPPQQDCWWLRTPGTNSSSASYVGTYNQTGAIWSSSATSSPNSSFNYIRPALWVGSGIFEATAARSGGVQNAYINTSAAPQNGSMDSYQQVDPNDTIKYELRFDRLDRLDRSSQPIQTIPNPTFQAKAPMPGKINFVNGSFETPPLAASNPLAYYPQAQVPGWSTRPAKQSETGSPDAYLIEIQKASPGGEYQTQFAPLTTDGGRQYAELNGRVEGTLYQICDTVPGAKIYYEFYHGARMQLLPPNVSTDVMNFYLRAEGATSGGLQRVCSDSAARGSPTYSWGHYTGTYTVPAGQKKTELAFETVSSASGDKSVGNFLDAVRLYSSSYVDLTKSNNAPSGKADGGDLITYTIVAQNKGESDASNVKILDTLPAGTELVPGTVKVDNVLSGDYNYNAAARQVSINVGAGATPSVGGLIRGDGSFSADCNNSYTITFQVKATGTAIAASNKYESQAGVTYQDRYDITNYSYTNYSNVNEFILERRNASAVITDVLPDGLTYLSHTATNGAVFSRTGQTCTWTWQDVPASDLVVTVIVKVEQNTEKHFVNRASLTTTGNAAYTNYTYHKIRGNTRTVTGLVFPMVSNTWGIDDGFLARHDVIVELRKTFLTPAPDSLKTIAEAAGNGATGRFTFENVPFGDYVLYIKRPGYLVRSMPVSINASSPLVVTLAPPGAADRGVFNLWWGDCNGDGRIDSEDVLRILDLMNVNSFSTYYDPACDLNADRLIDNEDVLLILEMCNKTFMSYAGTERVNPFS